LIYDTKGSISMTYAEIAEFRIGRAYQCRRVFIEKGREQKRSDINHHEAVWSFTKASIPVYSKGPEDTARHAGSRRENSFYREATQESGCSGKTNCECFRGLIKQHRYASFKDIPHKKGAWPRGVVKDRFSCSTVMIDWAIIRFHRFSDCWYRRGFGRSTRMNRN